MTRMSGKTAITLAALAAASVSTASAESREREEIHQTYDVGEHARLSLSNLNGDVRVSGWDKNQIDVNATKTAGSREHLEATQVHFQVRDDHVRIEVEHEDNHDWDNDFASVVFEIRVPRGARVATLELVNGDVELLDLRGDVEASSVNGEVKGDRLAGEILLSTVNGDVSLTASPGHDSIRLRSVNGSVTLVLPRDVNAKIDASTVHGEVHGELARGVTHAGKSMDAVLGTGGVRIDLDTVNGDIRIRRADGDEERKK